MSEDHYLSRVILRNFRNAEGKLFFVEDVGSYLVIVEATPGSAFYVINMNKKPVEKWLGNLETHMGNIVKSYKDGKSIERILLDEEKMRKIFSSEWHRSSSGTHAYLKDKDIEEIRRNIKNNTKGKSPPFLIPTSSFRYKKIEKVKDVDLYESGANVKKILNKKYSLVETKERMFKSPGTFPITKDVDGFVIHPNLVIVEHNEDFNIKDLSDSLLKERSVGVFGEVISDLNILTKEKKFIQESRIINKELQYEWYFVNEDLNIVNDESLNDNNVRYLTSNQIVSKQVYCKNVNCKTKLKTRKMICCYCQPKGE